MHLLMWLHDHEGASLTAASEALGLDVADAERLVMELVDAGMLAREPVQ